MRIIKLFSVTVLMSLTSFSASAEAVVSKEKFNWRPVMDAIMMVESRGNAKAKNGPHAGILQISSGIVTACNNILKSQGKALRYTLADRFSPKKSREMFVLFMSKYNPTNNIEKAIRMWHGGEKYTIKGSQAYYNKVKKYLR